MNTLSNKRILFIFIDGIGIGEENPKTNPFSRANLTCLSSLLGGKTLSDPNVPSSGARFSLIPLDACLGVEGMPQSATGQAVLMTGLNIPRILGYHYGPKPNDVIAEIISKGNIFSWLQQSNKSTFFMNAYPQRYFDGINSGRRLLSSIPLAVTSAGIRLNTVQDLVDGKALSADLTGNGWHQHLNVPDIPLYSPYQAGEKITTLAQQYDFSLIEYWLSDYAGHSQEMSYACEVLEQIDGMLCGLLSTWDDEDGLILITSDHGNLEDLNTHRHTQNPVPALVVGSPILRDQFTENLSNLADIAPAILANFGLQM